MPPHDPPYEQCEDLVYFLHAENISRDYNDFIKNTVLPEFRKQYVLKLREIRVLTAIASCDKAAYASYLSDLLRQDPATITRSLIVLIDQGYVESEEDSNDARSKLLKTTQKGSDASGHFLDIFKKKIESVISVSDTERFDHNHNALTRSIKLLATRAKAFKELQPMLHRALKN